MRHQLFIVTCIISILTLIVAIATDRSNSNLSSLMQQGRWEGKLYTFGLQERIYDFAPFRGSLTPEQEEQFNQIRNQVMMGAILIAS